MATFERSKKPNYPDLLSVKKFEATGIKASSVHSHLVTLDRWFRANPWLDFHTENEYKKHAAVIRKGEEQFNKEAFKELRKAFKHLQPDCKKAIDENLDNEEKYLERMAEVVDKFVLLFKKMEPLLEHEKSPETVFKMIKELQAEIKANAKPEKGGEGDAEQE